MAPIPRLSSKDSIAGNNNFYFSTLDCISDRIYDFQRVDLIQLAAFLCKIPTCIERKPQLITI